MASISVLRTRYLPGFGRAYVILADWRTSDGVAHAESWILHINTKDECSTRYKHLTATAEIEETVRDLGADWSVLGEARRYAEGLFSAIYYDFLHEQDIPLHAAAKPHLEEGSKGDLIGIQFRGECDGNLFGEIYRVTECDALADLAKGLSGIRLID